MQMDWDFFSPIILYFIKMGFYFTLFSAPWVFFFSLLFKNISCKYLQANWESSNPVSQTMLWWSELHLWPELSSEQKQSEWVWSWRRRKELRQTPRSAAEMSIIGVWAGVEPPCLSAFGPGSPHGFFIRKWSSMGLSHLSGHQLILTGESGMML